MKNIEHKINNELEDMIRYPLGYQVDKMIAGSLWGYLHLRLRDVVVSCTRSQLDQEITWVIKSMI